MLAARDYEHQNHSAVTAANCRYVHVFCGSVSSKNFTVDPDPEGQSNMDLYVDMATLQ
jgi:hypothetical protein